MEQGTLVVTRKSDLGLGVVVAETGEFVHVFFKDQDGNETRKFRAQDLRVADAQEDRYLAAVTAKPKDGRYTVKRPTKAMLAAAVEAPVAEPAAESAADA